MAFGELLLQRCSRPLQRAVHRGDARLEQRRHVSCRPAEHVAQDQRRPLPRRQELDGGEERQLDRLPGSDDISRLRPAFLNPFQKSVRVRLQPRQIGRGRKRSAGIRRRRAHLMRQHSSWQPLQRIQAKVRGDPVKPGPEQRTALEFGAPPPRPQECLLHVILGILHRAEHPIAVHLQLAPVHLGQPRESVFIPSAHRCQGSPVFDLGALGHFATLLG
jgi:hypothetical protein